MAETTGDAGAGAFVPSFFKPEENGDGEGEEREGVQKEKSREGAVSAAAW